MDLTVRLQVSSAKRSWSGWIFDQPTIIDGAAFSKVCLRALWAKLRFYWMCRQSTNHVHRRFRRSVLLDALVPTVMTSLIKRALFEIFGQSTNHRRRCNKRCVFCEGDRREAELCLYTGWIVLETRIPMVVLLCYYCLSFWRFGFEFGMSIVDVAGANPDCRGRFS
jgi:hypothetical protein